MSSIDASNKRKRNTPNTMESERTMATEEAMSSGEELANDTNTSGACSWFGYQSPDVQPAEISTAILLRLERNEPVVAEMNLVVDLGDDDFLSNFRLLQAGRAIGNSIHLRAVTIKNMSSQL